MEDWEKVELELEKLHKSGHKPGKQIFVAEGGILRLDFPDDWVVIPHDDSIRFYDKKPPYDDCCIAVSYMRLPSVDLSGLPLSEMLKVALEGDTRPIFATGEIHSVKRDDLELAWVELSFIDAAQQRDCRSRLCLGRGAGIQPLITMEFWEDDRARCEPVWEDVLTSLRLGAYQNPTRGPVPR